MNSNICLIIVFCFVIFSCKMQSADQKQTRKITAEDLINANRSLVGKDAAEIKKYLQENNIEMLETQTGLWYKIDKNGEGELASLGDIVEIGYTISLLDGTLCYSSDSLGYKTFKIGQGGVESGLEEGILLLKKGSKATFILPPHRAYGLVGDDDKIPGRSTLLYNVEVINLKK